MQLRKRILLLAICFFVLGYSSPQSKETLTRQSLNDHTRLLTTNPWNQVDAIRQVHGAAGLGDTRRVAALKNGGLVIVWIEGGGLLNP
jgi:hypothetical protein